jgi:hypothetical protein
MGNKAPEHPQEVKDAIYGAVKRRLNAAEVHRQLNAGHLLEYKTPYPMPLSTVQYYCRQARRRQAQQTVSKLAAGDPSHAIDHLARQLITEAELGITELRQAKARSPEKAKKWGELLRILSPLVRPGEADDNGRKPKRQPVPTDPLSRRLLAAENTGEAENDTSTTQHQDTAPTTEPDNHTNTPGGGVPAQAPIRTVVRGGGGSAAWS